MVTHSAHPLVGLVHDYGQMDVLVFLAMSFFSMGPYVVSPEKRKRLIDGSE